MIGVMNTLTAKITLLAALTVSLTGAALARAAAEPLQVDAALDRPVVNAGQDESVVVQIKISPERIISDRNRPPVNLSLVLDRSGSMQGDKIRQAIAAAQLAVSQLGPRDTISVIIYDDQIETLAASQYATEGNVREIEYALRGVTARGSTAIYAGLNRGAAELRKKADEGYINRIILLSDGLANQGPSSVDDFRALARAFAGEDIVVSTVGLGQGFNEDVMTTLAEAGQGNAYFVENADDLPRIFGAELGDALNVAATDIKIMITPLDGVRIKQSLGREAEILHNRATFRLPQVYGGLDKLALLELEVPRGEDGQTRELVQIDVYYQPVNDGQPRKQHLSVPIAYAADREAIAASANKDVAENVVENRIVDATIAGIDYSDSGQTSAGAANYRQVKEKIEQDYSFFGDSFTSAPSAKLEEEASALEVGKYSEGKRRDLREYEYQTKNQQTTRE